MRSSSVTFTPSTIPIPISTGLSGPKDSHPTARTRWVSPSFWGSPQHPANFLTPFPAPGCLSFCVGAGERRAGQAVRAAAATSLQGEARLRSREVRSVLPKDAFRGSYVRSAPLHALLPTRSLIFLFRSFNFSHLLSSVSRHNYPAPPCER